MQVPYSRDIVGGKQVEPAESAQHRIFGAPAADAVELEQSRHGLPIIEFRKSFEMACVARTLSSQSDQGAGLLTAEAKRPKRFGPCAGQFFRSRKCKGRRGAWSEGHSARSGKTVKQHDSNQYCELLTCDRVD